MAFGGLELLAYHPNLVMDIISKSVEIKSGNSEKKHKLSNSELSNFVAK